LLLLRAYLGLSLVVEQALPECKSGLKMESAAGSSVSP